MKSDHHSRGHEALFIPFCKVDGARTGAVIDQVAFVTLAKHQSHGHLQVSVVPDVVEVRDFLANHGIEKLHLRFTYGKELRVVDRDFCCVSPATTETCHE